MSASGVVSLVLLGYLGLSGWVGLIWQVHCVGQMESGLMSFLISWGLLLMIYVLHDWEGSLGSRCKCIVFHHLGVFEAKSTGWAYTY